MVPTHGFLADRGNPPWILDGLAHGGRERIAMLQMRLDKPASEVLRDLHRLGPGATLCDQARQVRTGGQEPAFVERLDPNLKVEFVIRHGGKIDGAGTFASHKNNGERTAARDLSAPAGALRAGRQTAFRFRFTFEALRFGFFAPFVLLSRRILAGCANFMPLQRFDTSTLQRLWLRLGRAEFFVVGIGDPSRPLCT